MFSFTPVSGEAERERERKQGECADCGVSLLVSCQHPPVPRVSISGKDVGPPDGAPRPAPHLRPSLTAPEREGAEGAGGWGGQ